MTTPRHDTWHADDSALRAFADGVISPVLGAAVEAHLMSCAGCRERVNALMPQEPLADAWSHIRSAVEAPRASLVERLLTWMGVSVESGRLLAAVPAMRGAWLMGMMCATLFAGLALLLSSVVGISMFLLIAPLAPVAGVAASFGGDADPSHELVTVAPHPASRLLLLRTAGVLATSIPVATLVGLWLPGPAWLAVAWLTPAAAGVAIALVLTPALGATTAATSVAVCWSVAVLATARAQEPLTLVQPTMHLVFAALALAAAATLLLRHTSFDQLGRLS
jgi:Putative zinc-finger